MANPVFFMNRDDFINRDVVRRERAYGTYYAAHKPAQTFICYSASNSE